MIRRLAFATLALALAPPAHAGPKHEKAEEASPKPKPRPKKPAPADDAAPAPEDELVHIVKPGETLGGIAQRVSDRVYLTTDNPRSERVEDIIADIRGGMKNENVVVELDRTRAIHAAINECRPGELVALLGKGHEDYQIIGAEKLPWSDRRAAEEGLAQWSAR